MNTLLLLDTETGGLDPVRHPLLEIGAVTWSIEHGCVLACWSTLVNSNVNEAAHVNRIPVKALRHGMDRGVAIETLRGFASQADVVIAHQADFDRGFIPDLGKPWVCSKTDIKWPLSEQGAKLVVTALDHGVGVTHAHRALADCLILARLFERMVETGQDVRALVQRGLRPKGVFQAMTSYEERQVTKDNGFKWKPETKQWLRTMAIEDAEALPFRVSRVD